MLILNIKVGWSLNNKKLNLPMKNPKTKKNQKRKSIISKLTQEFLSISGLQKCLEVYCLIKINFNFVSFAYIFLKNLPFTRQRIFKTMIFCSFLRLPYTFSSNFLLRLYFFPSIFFIFENSTFDVISCKLYNDRSAFTIVLGST